MRIEIRTTDNSFVFIFKDSEGEVVIILIVRGQIADQRLRN